MGIGAAFRVWAEGLLEPGLEDIGDGHGKCMSMSAPSTMRWSIV